MANPKEINELRLALLGFLNKASNLLREVPQNMDLLLKELNQESQKLGVQFKEAEKLQAKNSFFNETNPDNQSTKNLHKIYDELQNVLTTTNKNNNELRDELRNSIRVAGKKVENLEQEEQPKQSPSIGRRSGQ